MGDDSIESPLKGKWVNYHPSTLHHNMEIEILCVSIFFFFLFFK